MNRDERSLSLFVSRKRRYEVADAGVATPCRKAVKNRRRPLLLLASSGLVLMAGCDSRTGSLIEPQRGERLNFEIHQSEEPITGIYSAVVTDAADLNNASFGRDPSEWVGETVTGTFSIHLATPGVGDRDPDPDVWVLGPVPGPGPFIEFVTVKALIDGQVFQTSSADFETIFFGDVVGILDLEIHSAFNPQDSYVGAGPAGTGRSVVGFDASFGPGGVSFDGSKLTIDPALLQLGHGVIDDLLGNGATVHRQGTISFRLTKVSVTRLGGLMEEVIELAGFGMLQPDQVAGLVNKLEEIAAKLEAGNVRPACQQLGAFINQVQAFINGGHLTAEAGQSLIDGAEIVKDELEC